MSILDRDALAASPLADLHALASELSIDGYRRLRKAGPDRRDHRPAGWGRPPEERSRRGGGTRRRWRRGKRGRSPATRSAPFPATRSAPFPATRTTTRPLSGDEEPASPGRAVTREDRLGLAGRRRGTARGVAAGRPCREDDAGRLARRHRRERGAGAGPADGDECPRSALLTRRSSRARSSCSPERIRFPARATRPSPRRTTSYVSAAQVKRCELVPGDRISGPSPRAAAVRAVRIADPGRHDQRPPRRRGGRQHPVRRSAGRLPLCDRFRLGSDDPTIKAIEW